MSGPSDKYPFDGHGPIGGRGPGDPEAQKRSDVDAQLRDDASTNDGVDDQFLDEYLKGNSTVSQQYRQVSADEVPADLDRLVLRHAHAAVKGQRKKRLSLGGWRRWSAPLALAASAVLVLSIVIESGVQRESMMMAPNAPVEVRMVEEPERRTSVEQDKAIANVEVPPSFAMAPAPMIVADEPSAPVETAPAADEVTVTARQWSASVPPPEAALAITQESPVTTAIQMATQIRPPPPLSAPASQPPTPPVLEGSSSRVGGARPTTASAEMKREARDEANALEEAIVTGYRRQQPAQRSGPRGTITIPEPGFEAEDEDAAEASSAGRASTLQHKDPEVWLSDIRQLRKDDKQEEADREWRNFLKAYPDYPVAESDIAREKQPR